MFERFTERAREVVVLGQDEARLFKHNYIGTEHLLLGLLREEEGLAARVLDTLDITVEEVRAQVARIVGQGDKVATGQIPFTPRVKKVFELALKEAMAMGCDRIGTEHILLGVVRENEGVAARILLDFDVDAECLRGEVLRLVSRPGERSRTSGRSDRFWISAERTVATQRYDESPSPRLLVACPGCTTPIEIVLTDQRNAHLQVSMRGTHACRGCGRRWTLTIDAKWTDPSPPADPEDDLPPSISVRHRYEPPHFGMFCFRCDHFLEQVTLGQAATSALHIEAKGDRTCPSCGKPWRISYSVSWEEGPGALP